LEFSTRNPSLDITKKSVTITDTDEGDVIPYAIIGYDVTDDGLCPTEVCAFQLVD